MTSHPSTEDAGEQLIEVEMLQSMFAGDGEFTMKSDAEVLAKLASISDGSVDASGEDAAPGAPGGWAPVCMSVKFQVTALDLQVPMELEAEMPASYPSADLPSFQLRSATLGRAGQASLLAALDQHVREEFQDSGAPGVVVAAFMWLQEGEEIEK